MLRRINETKAYVIREFATMRDGAIICKVMDKEGNTNWIDINDLELINLN